MLNQRQQEQMVQPLLDIYNNLEDSVITDIVRRLRLNGNEITRAADWQLHRLTELGYLKNDIETKIQRALKLSDKELDKIYNDILVADYAHNKAIYQSRGKIFKKFEDNETLQQLFVAVKKQTQNDFINITQSLGFATRLADGKITHVGLSEYYQKTLDECMLGIANGLFDYNTALKNTVSKMVNSGLRFIDQRGNMDRVEYSSGWSNRIPVAVRRAVLTGYGQVTAQINETIADDLGTDKFEVNYHHGARPAHAEWQGRVYTKTQLISVCGLGSGSGLCGWNCYHNYYPFIDGISERTYTDDELKQMEKEDKEEKEYNGIRYNRYKAQQQQRKLETQMRANREYIKQLKIGGASDDDITAAKSAYNTTSKEYTQFCKYFGLREQRERVSIDGLNGVLTKSRDDVILKEIDKELKASGVVSPKIGKAELPTPAQIMSYNSHALQRMIDRGITEANAQGYIDNARIAFNQGNVTAYYSNAGYAVLRKIDNQLITAINNGNYDVGTKKILEVITKYGY